MLRILSLDKFKRFVLSTSYSMTNIDVKKALKRSLAEVGDIQFSQGLDSLNYHLACRNSD